MSQFLFLQIRSYITNYCFEKQNYSQPILFRSESLTLYFASRSSTSVHHFTAASEIIITILFVCQACSVENMIFTSRIITLQDFLCIFSKFIFLVALIKLFQKLSVTHVIPYIGNESQIFMCKSTLYMIGYIFSFNISPHLHSNTYSLQKTESFYKGTNNHKFHFNQQPKTITINHLGTLFQNSLRLYTHIDTQINNFCKWNYSSCNYFITPIFI